MEATTSLVMKVTGNGCWKGKVGKYNLCWTLSRCLASVVYWTSVSKLIISLKPPQTTLDLPKHQSPHPKPIKPNPITYQAHQ